MRFSASVSYARIVLIWPWNLTLTFFGFRIKFAGIYCFATMSVSVSVPMSMSKFICIYALVPFFCSSTCTVHGHLNGQVHVPDNVLVLVYFHVLAHVHTFYLFMFMLRLIRLSPFMLMLKYMYLFVWMSMDMNIFMFMFMLQGRLHVNIQEKLTLDLRWDRSRSTYYGEKTLSNVRVWGFLIPLAFCFPLLIPFAPLSIPLYLLGTLLAVIGSHPPWSQVTRKLTSPFPTPSHSLPTPNSQHPG